MYTNMECFNNKIAEFEFHVNEYNPALMRLTELNPKNSN